MKASHVRVNTLCFGYYASCLICHLISFTFQIPTALLELFREEIYWKLQQVIKCKSNKDDEDRATGILNFGITKRWYMSYTLQNHQYQLHNALKAFWTCDCKQIILRIFWNRTLTVQFLSSSFTVSVISMGECEYTHINC